MVEMATHWDQRYACQSTADTPKKCSTQLMTPKSRWNKVPNTIATAATEVTLGTSTVMRRNVRAFSGRFSRLARNSARANCGTVATTNIPKVFSTAFQKYG